MISIGQIYKEPQSKTEFLIKSINRTKMTVTYVGKFCNQPEFDPAEHTESWPIIEGYIQNGQLIYDRDVKTETRYEINLPEGWSIDVDKFNGGWCKHELTAYIGLVETYNYCKTCGLTEKEITSE